MARPSKKISLRKGKKRAPKGVIHVQASFNNTIVTVTDVRGQTMSWSSAGSCGFKGAKKVRLLQLKQLLKMLFLF